MMTARDWIAAATAVVALCLGALYGYSTRPPQDGPPCVTIGDRLDVMGNCVR